MPQRHLAPPLHLVPPLALLFLLRIDPNIPPLPHVHENFDDPVGLGLGAGGPVGEGGGGLGAVEVEEVGEGRDTEAEVGEDAGGPFLGEGEGGGEATEGDVIEAAGYGVEACTQRDSVEFMDLPI